MAVTPPLALSFGRLGDKALSFFPENCSSSAPSRIKYSRHSSELAVHTLFARLARAQFHCSAITSGDYLSENDSSESFLLAEIRKRKTGLSSLLGNDDDSKPILPFWQRVKLQSRGLTNRVVELSKRKQLNEVFELLESAKQVDRKVNRKTMNAVLEACVRCHDIHRAMQVFKSMSEVGSCGVDEVSYGTVIKAGMLDNAFQIIESMEAGTAPGGVKLSIIHLNTLINACANAGDARRAHAVLVRYRSVVKDNGPNLVTYNMLIKGYARSDNPLEALKVREEMQLRGVRPNKLTFNSLVLAGVRGQDLNLAFEILDEMKEAGKADPELAPDVVTYTTLIKALATDGDLQGVLDMVAEMKNLETCVLDRVGYTSIIDACIAAGSPADGMVFLQEMQFLAKVDSQLRPRAHAFLALMRAFAEKGEVDSVLSLRSKMVSESSGHVWPEDRLEADELLIEAAVNDGQWSLGIKVLKTIADLDKNLPLSQRGYMAIVRLQAMTGFKNNALSPWIIRQEVSLDGPVGSILHDLSLLKPVSAAQRLRDVVMSFWNENVLPVVEGSGKCVGTVHARDCNQVDACLSDMMRPPPPVLSSSCSLFKVISTLLETGTSVLGVSCENEQVRFITKVRLLQHLSTSGG